MSTLRRTRKRFTVYEPDYKPGGFYKTVYSWFQVNKLCAKLGTGTTFNVCRLRVSTQGGRRIISFWNVEEQYKWK